MSEGHQRLTESILYYINVVVLYSFYSMNHQKKEISFDRFVNKYQRSAGLPNLPLDYNE